MISDSYKSVSKALACVLAVLLISVASFAQGGSVSGGISFGPSVAGTPLPPHITSGNPPNGTQGAGYQFNFTGTCANGPCTWSQLSGTLPPGTTLDSDGTLHATALGTAGTYSFSVKFLDTFSGLFDTNPIAYQVTINAQVPGAFMVWSGGDNAHGCSFLQPCNGDSAGFAAAKTAVQLLPSGSKTVTLRGAVPSNQEDMLDWLLIGVSGRTGLHKTGVSLYDANWLDADTEKLWQLKGSGGNPWDIETYGAGCPLAGYICDWMTENGDIPGGFNNPLAYKKLIIPVPVMPRMFTLGTRIVVDTANPKSKRTANCETDNPPDTSPGDVRGVLEGPFTNKDFGGDIGVQPYLRNSYYYSGNLTTNVFHDKELRYYVKGMGRVLWEHYTCTGSNCNDITGTWVFQQNSLKNILTAGASPVPNFPCGNTIPNWIGGPVPTAGQNLLPDVAGVYRLSSTLTFAAGDSGTGVGDVVTWKNYPGESAKISGLKRITGLSYLGSGEYTVSLPAASWQNFEMLLVNGVRRPRPRTDTGSAHGYYPNNCPTSTNDDPLQCVTGVAAGACTTGTAQNIADCQCACDAALLATGAHCAGLQTKVCTIAGSTPWQCFNKYEYSGSDISGSWHGIGVGDVEVLPFETWTMPRMRLKSASGGLAIFKGATQTSNDHGCQGGHFFISDNVKELAGPGDWYLDRDADNNGVLDTNMTLHIWTNPGENILGADIEVPQLAPSTPLISATGINWFSLVSNNTGSFAGVPGVPVTSGLFFEGDNWQPPATGYTDQQGMPAIDGALTFTTANNVVIDGITVQHTMGWGIDFQGTSTHNTVQKSHLTNLGAGGVRFGTSVIGKAAADPADTDLNVPQYNTVNENLIDNIGRVQPGGEPSGIFLGDGHHNSFQHNEIANSYIGGIQMCFGLKSGADDGSTSQQFFCHDNDVGFNLIYDQPNPILADHSGIYTAPSDSQNCPAGTPLTGNPCNIIHDNVIHDIFNNYDLTGSAATSGGRGLYCDQGCHRVLFKNNLVYRTGQSGIFINDPQHTGPNHFLSQDVLVDNNIFAFFGYQNAGFTVSLAKSCIANSGQGPNRFTFQHNICYGNFTDALSNMQILPSGSWICYANDLTTQVPCSQRFVFANNDYWNIFSPNALAFAVCKTVACPNPFNNTNYWRFGPSNGTVPTGWQAPYQFDLSGNLLGAGEDAGSTAVDPGFVSTTCGAENWHYSANFTAQGIIPFDYTQAGRQVNTFPIPAVPDLFPIRPINCSDFAGGGGVPVASLSVTSLSFGAQTIFTTSASQTVTVTNTGTATLSFSSITPSGDFAQANNCVPSLAPSASCTITVTFTPTALGARTGSIAIADNAAGSPQTISLTGTGVATTGGGDNRYCNSSNVVVGLSDDTWGTVTAAKLAHCINTDRANTPSLGTVRVVTDNASLTAAIGVMACGDEIRITKASRLTGTFTLPAKACNNAHWITIDSSGVSDPSFPAEGTRTSPCWSGVASRPNRPTYVCPAPQELTARFTVTNNTNAFKILGDHYRFIGLEITRTTTPGIVFNLVDTTLGQPAGQQHHIIFDRCYLHGVNGDAEMPYTAAGQSKEAQRGIAFGQSNNFAVIDSYLSDFYCISSFGTCSDAQTISWGIGGTQNSGWGTYKIVNNYLEASTEGVLPGGSSGPALSPPGCTPLVDCNIDSPLDTELRRNYFFKPQTWNGNTTVIVTAGWPVVKNGFEIKNGVRLLIEGNVVRGTWPSAQTQAYAWLLAPKNQRSSNSPFVGTCLTCIVTDVSLRYNYAYDVGGGPGIFTAMGASCPSCASQGGYRIVHRDNLIEHMHKGSLASSSLVDGFEFTANTGSPLNQIAFVHNGIVPTVRSFGTWGAQTTGLMNNWYFDNNYILNGANGLLHIGGTGTCDQPFVGNPKGLLDACVTTYSFQKNDVLNGIATNWPTDGNGLSNFFHTPATLLFTNYNGGDSLFNPGNYLLQPTSPGHHAGTDSKDIGPDMNALLNAISGVAQ